MLSVIDRLDAIGPDLVCLCVYRTQYCTVPSPFILVCRFCERMKSDRIYNFMCMNPRTVISDALVRFQTLYDGSWPEP
jgi:hypothetical protein